MNYKLWNGNFMFVFEHKYITLTSPHHYFNMVQFSLGANLKTD